MSLLPEERLDLRLDALQHVLRRILRLPPKGPRTTRPDPAVRAPHVRELQAREVLEELLLRERRRLRSGGNSELDESLANGVSELVPRVFAVLAVVVALPAVSGCVWVRADGVEERDEELRG